MKKKKILTAAMALSIISILAVGGSLAYFTDSDEKQNVFTTGDVDIALNETFEQGSKLVPGGENMNVIPKVVEVENTGTESAYVRTHIAVPKAIDEYIKLVPEKATESNVTYWNWEENVYDTTIDGKEYTVHVVTYNPALDSGKTTESPAMTELYMLGTVTNEIIASLKEAGAIGTDNTLDIKVMAEAVQTAGFDSPSIAFTTAFGELSATNNPFNGYGE